MRIESLRPLHDRVLVERVVAAKKTAGGLEIPESVREKRHEGTVIAVGPEVPKTIRVGDLVIYKPFAGSFLEDDGKEYFIMLAEEIFAVIE